MDSVSGGLSPVHHRLSPAHYVSMGARLCLKKAASIHKDLHHLGRALFSLLLLGRRHRGLKIQQHQLLFHNHQALNPNPINNGTPWTTSHREHVFLIMFSKMLFFYTNVFAFSLQFLAEYYV